MGLSGSDGLFLFMDIDSQPFRLLAILMSPIVVR